MQLFLKVYLTTYAPDAYDSPNGERRGFCNLLRGGSTVRSGAGLETSRPAPRFFQKEPPMRFLKTVCDFLIFALFLAMIGYLIFA